MNNVRHITVQKEDGEPRLDRWFKRHFPHIGHGQLQKLLRTGQIRVDGRRAKAGTRISPGQSVRIPPGLPERRKAETRRPAVTDQDKSMIAGAVLYQDDAVVVLNKPSGLAVQGGSGTYRHIDAMLDVFARRSGPRPRLVHRLDKDTSGVLVIARTSAAAQALGRAFRTGDCDKIYWALVAGVPEQPGGMMSAPLKKRGSHRGEQVRIDETGKHAKTDYTLVDQAGNKLAWLALRPRTGRTHQLRVHCAALGTPIVGDKKYGGDQALIEGEIPDRLHLHARRLRIAHPDGGQIDVTAPLPDHMRESWSILGFDENAALDTFDDEAPQTPLR